MIAPIQTKTDHLKRLIGQTRKGKERSFFLAEHDGRMWATNTYWAFPAEVFAKILAGFNFSPNEPGSFHVSTVLLKVDDGAAPAIDRVFPDISDLVPIERENLHGRLAALQCGDVFGWSFVGKDDGTEVPSVAAGVVPRAINVVYHDYAETIPEKMSNRYGDTFENPRWLGHPDNLGKPCVLMAERMGRRGGHMKEGGGWVPEERYSKGDEVLALVMPLKLGATR